MTRTKRRSTHICKLREKTRVFDSSLIFRRGGPVDAAADAGPPPLPELSRRQTAFFQTANNRLQRGTGATVPREKRRAGSCAKLVEHSRVGLHEADQVLRLENAQGTEVGPGLGETIEFV